MTAFTHPGNLVAETKESRSPRWKSWLAGMLPMLFLMLPCMAKADFSSNSAVETPAGFKQDNGFSSSTVSIDAQNFAQSFVQPMRDTLGASASNSNAGYTSFSRTTFRDSWVCSACELVLNPYPAGIVPLSLDFHLDGFFTDFGLHGDGTGGPSIELLASYEIGVLGTFDLRLQENVFDSNEGPLGAGSSGTYARFCRQGGGCTPLGIAFQSFTDGAGNDLIRFSVDSSLDNLMCPGCAGGFVDETSIQVSVTGGEGPVAMIDAAHTFSVGLRSEDPRYQLASAAGRTGGIAVSPVPEPETLPLMVAGLGLIGLVLRRRDRQR